MIWIVFLKIMNLKHHHSSMKNNEKKLILDLYKHYKSATEITVDEMSLLYSKHGNIRNILRYLIQEFEPNSEVTEEYLDEKLKIYNLSEVEENYDKATVEIEIKKSEVKKIKKSKIIIYISLILLLLFTYLSIIAPINRNYNDATNVKNFAEDKENVFVNTFYGLFKIKKETNEISEVKGLGPYLQKIVVDKNDEKWVISYDTLYSFKNEQKITKHNLPNKNFKSGYGYMMDLTIDQLGTKWILVDEEAYEYELYSYDFGHWQKYSFPEKVKGLRPDMLINEYDDMVLPLNSKKIFFLENYGAAGDLGEINSFRTREWSQLDYPSTDFYLNKSFVDKEHSIWISGFDSLYRLQDIDFINYNIKKEIKALDSDTNGKVWIATEDGIEILNEKNSLIPKKEITNMFIDSNNKKWIEERRHGIECYDGKEWKSYNFEIFKHVVKEFFNNLF